jgi:hypothetical protein
MTHQDQRALALGAFGRPDDSWHALTFDVRSNKRSVTPSSLRSRVKLTMAAFSHVVFGVLSLRQASRPMREGVKGEGERA